MTYTVQVGSFLKKENALHLKRSLDSMYNTVFIREWNDRKETFYRVRVGKYTREEDAQKISRRLQKQNYSAFVTAH
jgi:rare lipoprotein A